MPFYPSFFRSCLLSALLASALPWTSSAAPSLSLPGLTFDNFACSVTRGGIAALPSDCRQILIQPLLVPNHDSGIRISSDFIAAPFSFDDAILAYHVSSRAGIDRVDLAFNGAYFGLAISSATEYVFSGRQLLASAQVFCGYGVGCKGADNILLNGAYQDLTIVKDINVTSLIGIAGESIIDQRFGVVPEPSSGFLLSLGLLLGIVFLGKRYSQQR